MAAVSENLVFGANPDYIERQDGYGILKETYGLNFKDVKDIDIGLKYQAMDSGDIDVTNGYTTDAQLSRDDVVVLEDDKHLQVNYFCSTVVRKEALEEYAGLEDVLNLMEGLISDKEMATMNYAVEVDGKDEAEVAKSFLASKGMIEE
jgi:osmoprotectant transport system permease protein